MKILLRYKIHRKFNIQPTKYMSENHNSHLILEKWGESASLIRISTTKTKRGPVLILIRDTDWLAGEKEEEMNHRRNEKIQLETNEFQEGKSEEGSAKCRK